MIEKEGDAKIKKTINRPSELSATGGSIELEVRSEILGASPVCSPPSIQTTDLLICSLKQFTKLFSIGQTARRLRRDVESKFLQHGYAKFVFLPRDKRHEPSRKVL